MFLPFHSVNPIAQRKEAVRRSSAGSGGDDIKNRASPESSRVVKRNAPVSFPRFFVCQEVGFMLSAIPPPER